MVNGCIGFEGVDLSATIHASACNRLRSMLVCPQAPPAGAPSHCNPHATQTPL
jgi:hypothetical protein